MQGTNRALAQEARTTNDVSRQAELAHHNSDIVLHALSENPHLDPSLFETVQNRLNQIRATAHDAAEKTVKE